MCRHILILSTVLMILTACTGNQNSDGEASSTIRVCSSGACTAVDARAPLGIDLTASEVIGGSIESGSGTGRIEVDRGSGIIRGSVTFERLEPDAVSLHRGFAGERGPLLISLDRVGSTEWSLPPSTVLIRSDVDALDAGGLYLEATTARSSAPAVRGQIIRGGVTEAHFIQLSGAQAVPAVSSAATAIGAITMGARIESGVVSGESFVIHVNSRGLDDIVAVHAHAAPAGTNGPILANLVQDPDDPSHWFSRGSFEDSEDIRQAFESSTLYLDVHTAAHPDGEIRGQAGPSHNVAFISLDGADVVPSVDTSNRGTVATTTTGYDGWDWAQKIDMHVNLSGLDDATAVTINYAALAQNGPVVYSLDQDPDNRSQWSITGALLRPSGFSPASVRGGWYVSVATPRFPAGEVRGQIENHSAFHSGDDALEVTTVNPADGATVKTLPSAITVGFNRNVLAASVNLERIELLASGGDASFSDGNEVAITPIAVNVDGPSLRLDLTDVSWQDDTYQLAIPSTGEAPITDTAGTPLTRDFLSTFVVDAEHHSPPTFQRIQDVIFTPGCAEPGCHSGARPPRGLDLSSGVSYGNIVNMPSAEEPRIDLIEPGHPESSYLYSKLHSPGEPRLSNSMIQMLREWIAAGAKND